MEFAVSWFNMSSSSVGRIVPVRDPKASSAGLGFEDGFLLNTIDGTMSLDDLADVTGSTLQATVLAVSKLLDRGLLRRDAALERACAFAAFSADSSPSATSSAPASVRRPSAAPRAAARPLTADERALITGLARSTESSDMFAVLGVPRDATRPEVRRAYLALAGKCHPDRFFGRDLGDQRGVLEKVFTRVTNAYDTLRTTAPKARCASGPVPAQVNTPVPQPLVSTDDRKRALAARLGGTRTVRTA